MSEHPELKQANTESGTGQPKVTVLTIIGSIFAGWFGVQSNENRERDFTHGKASTFIYAGLIFLALFVGFVFVLVKLVLHLAGT